MIEVRASALRAIITCPGYLRVQSAHRTDTPATRSGSLAHAYIAEWLANGQPAADALWPQFVEEWGETADPSEEIRSIVRAFMAWAGQRWADVLFMGKVLEVPLRHEFNAIGVALNGTADCVVFGDAGTVHLYDWKLYRDPSYLPPIAEDLQMAAYALLLRLSAPQLVQRVVVNRALVRQCATAEYVYDGAALEVAERAILRVLVDYARDPDQLVLGPHCHSCLARNHCHEYPKLAASLPAECAPWDGLQISSTEQARRIALALRPAEELLERAREQLKAWVVANGPVVDGNMEWSAGGRSMEHIVDHASVISKLAEVADADTALAASQTSKGKIESALVASGRPDMVGIFLEAARSAGWLRKSNIEVYQWRKRKLLGA